MDLELTDEQTLAQRVADHAPGARLAARGDRAHRDAASSARGCGPRCRSSALGDELGAVELCLAARLLGAHLASTPFLGSAALRYAGVPHATSAWRSRCPRTAGRARRPRSIASRSSATGRSRSSPRRDATIEPAASLDVGVPLFTVTVRRRRAAGRRRRAAHRDRRAARRRGVRRRGRAHARGRARLRRRAPPVRPHDRLLPGAAPHPGRHVRAPRERVVDGALRRRRARRRPARRPADRGDREGLRGPRRARGRARRAAGLRRHRLHRGASGAPLPAAHHRARAAVRGRRAPRARARPRARGLRAGAGAA